MGMYVNFIKPELMNEAYDEISSSNGVFWYNLYHELIENIFSLPILNLSRSVVYQHISTFST